MPHYKEPEKLTPWAQVLTDFMWNQRSPRRPPLTVPQLAIRLGMPRQNVGAWVYRDVVPGFEIMMAVLARLHIPLRTLYDAYVSAGLPMPAWDVQDVQDVQDVSGVKEAPEAPEIPRRRRQTAFPVEETERRTSKLSELSAPEPLPYTPPPARDPAQENAEEWERVIAQTTAALRSEGMPQASIDAVVASLRARQAGQSTAERQIQAEHQEDQQTQESESSEPSERQTKRRGHQGQLTSK